MAHSVGPRLTATLSYFSGCHGLSKRGVEEIAEAVFAAPVSLARWLTSNKKSVPRWRRTCGSAGRRRAAPVKHADETSWNCGASCAGCGRRTTGVVPSSFMPNAARWD